MENPIHVSVTLCAGEETEAERLGPCSGPHRHRGSAWVSAQTPGSPSWPTVWSSPLLPLHPGLGRLAGPRLQELRQPLTSEWMVNTQLCWVFSRA